MDYSNRCSKRIDSHRPAIVPVSQSQLERSDDPLGTVRTILDQWLYRRDLFAVNSPVVGNRFFGRDRALSELRAAIQTGASAGVFGLRKVGKTSLLKETARRFTEVGDIVVYLDLLTRSGRCERRATLLADCSELFARAPRKGLPELEATSRWRLRRFS